MHGKTDPATGYHSVYTLSSGWHSDKNASMPMSNQLDSAYFAVPKPLPFLAWLDEHLRHINPSTARPMMPLGVMIYSTSGNITNYMVDIQEGYPYPRVTGATPMPVTLLEQKRILVAEQPATWSVYKVDYSNLLPPTPATARVARVYYIYGVMTKVRDQPLWYNIVGYADPDHRTQVEHEIRATTESFRIEKAGGK